MQESHSGFYEAIIENIGGGIIVVDAAGRVSKVNRSVENQYGIDRAEAAGRPFWEVFPSWEGEDVERLIRRILETGQEYENERVRLPAKDSGGEVVNIAIRPFMNPDGGTRSAVVMIDYIGDKVRLEEHLIHVNEELYRANRAKMDFLSMVSHELRTPLTLIKMYTALLADSKLGPLTAKQEKALEVMGRRCTSLNRLIGDLLDLSRIEAGSASLDLESFSIQKAVVSAAANFEHSILEKNLDVIIDVEPGLPPLIADQDKIQRVVNNLLENAVKFTEPGGKISVRARMKRERGEDEPECMLISVEDTGIGIPEAEFGKIFERFHQVDGSDTRKHTGSGLGLTIAKEIVALHNGELRLESEEGRGSTFTFSIPLNPADFRAQPPEDTVAEGGRPAAGLRRAPDEPKTFLLIDDDEDFLEVVEDLLRPVGFEIETATDGIKGIDKALAQPQPDAILLDVTMPRLSGYDVCRFLKSLKSTKHIPILMLTAAGKDDQVTLGYEAGASGYLVKPFEIPEFESELERILKDE
ncbi:MAG: ATP-binding protein [bacterium]